jgi:hypothetical protein
MVIAGLRDPTLSTTIRLRGTHWRCNYCNSLFEEGTLLEIVVKRARRSMVGSSCRWSIRTMIRNRGSPENLNLSSSMSAAGKVRAQRTSCCWTSYSSSSLPSPTRPLIIRKRSSKFKLTKAEFINQAALAGLYEAWPEQPLEGQLGIPGEPSSWLAVFHWDRVHFRWKRKYPEDNSGREVSDILSFKKKGSLRLVLELSGCLKTAERG